MADILIKGLALPKKGDTYGLHLSIFPNGDVYVEYDEEPTATAVALPEHHGRLGDLDKIAKRFHGFFEKHLENGSYETAEIWQYAEHEVRLQGTVVEATG